MYTKMIKGKEHIYCHFGPFKDVYKVFIGEEKVFVNLDFDRSKKKQLRFSYSMTDDNKICAIQKVEH